MSSELRIVTNMTTLMRLAHDLGQARQSEDPERIAEAQRRHDAYHALCLSSDEFVCEVPRG